MNEDQKYIDQTSPPYYMIKNDTITSIPISFPLKPISFQRNKMFEDIFYKKFREKIPYDYILLFKILPPDDYLHLPFYFYSFDQDLYSSYPNHPFFGLWFSFIHPNQELKFPWYDMGKICEESLEIHIHSSHILYIDFLMRLSLEPKIKKIFYHHPHEIKHLQNIYSKSITWQFIQI